MATGPDLPPGPAPAAQPSPYPQTPPAYPQAPAGYAPAPSPYGRPSPPATGSASANPVGLVAFIAGMLLVLWQLAGAAIQGSIVVAGGITGLEAFGWINSAIGLVLGLVAVVAGIISILLRGRPRVLGAIGLGVGILNLAGVLSYAVVYPLLTGLA